MVSLTRTFLDTDLLAIRNTSFVKIKKKLKMLIQRDTLVFFLSFCFRFCRTQNFQRAGYSWAASCSVIGKKNQLFLAGLEPTIFRV